MSVTPHELIESLKKADDAYYNSNPIMSDSEYDVLYKAAKKALPHHVYFTGVGSDVRGGKIKLPYQMGSLDQVYDTDVEKWIANNKLSNETCIITEKLDGTSAMIVYDDNGDLQIAYSRGNGIEGADITRHIKNIPAIPNKVSGAMVVRGEVIISKKNFPTLQENHGRHSTGEAYKNARNAVAGIMNRKTNDPKVYQYVTFVAYEIVGSELQKSHMLNVLTENDFLIPNLYVLEGQHMDGETLNNLVNDLRDESLFEIDGVVIDVNSAAKRSELNPTRETLNPAYSVKYKLADASNYAEAKVVDVELNVSKHGYVKPTIIIEPTELVGVTVTRCTGFNMKYIRDNMIQPGCVIKLQRSGDVIPFCMGVVKPGSIEYLTG